MNTNPEKDYQNRIVKEFQNKFRQSVATGNLEQTFITMKEILKDDFTDLCMIQARNAEIEKQNQFGMIAHTDYTITKNQIFDSTLKMINNIEFKTIDLEKLRKAQIHQRIKLVCYDSEAVQKIKHYFPIGYFPKVSDDAIIQGNVDFKKLKNDFDLVIFDAYHHVPKGDENYRDNILKEYIDNGPPVLYFGKDENDIVNDYRHRVHAANSPFSLYARLYEMIDYLKYNGVVDEA